MLTTVRRSNVVCGFPAPRFHEGSLFCAAMEGISFTSCTNPYSPYSLRFGSLPPAAVAPAFVPMRPDAPLDPIVEFVEERSDVGPFVIVSPPPQDWVELLNQILGLERYPTPGKLAYPILKALDRFLSGVGIQPARFGTRDDLARRQLKLLAAPDQVTQKFKSTLHMHYPRLLRMQLHVQFAQNPEGRGDSRARLSRRLTGNHPIVCEPRKLITLASHLPIKRRQKYVTEQGRDDSPNAKGNFEFERRVRFLRKSGAH